MRRLSVGEWQAAEAVEPDVHHRGFLVIDGLISREVEVLGRRACELLGPGDVTAALAVGSRWLPRPLRGGLEGARTHASGCAGSGADCADGTVAAARAGVFARGTRRAHSLAIVLAIAHHQRVDDRLILTLWHLADRWGRVSTDGVILPLPLPHQRLAELVGAHRPSVTTATGELVRAGRIKRREDGTWLLLGPPPDELGHHRLIAAMS